MIKDICDNSFFHQNLNGKKVLVLVPHEDDEINVAGNAIVNLVNMGAEIFVVYTTNGDFAFPAELRLSEAAKALEILGVDSSHIIILGYGDTLNNYGKPHIFYAHASFCISPSGHYMTYGAAGFDDYSFQKNHRHNSYTYDNYLNDLKSVILDIKADIIFCVDYDTHADHRMLTIAFESVMGIILNNSKNTYFPEIYKGFAYCTAFFAIQDFYEINLLHTMRPINDKTYNYPIDTIDLFCYLWNKRVRIPINEKCRSKFLNKNLLAKALKEHFSQNAVSHAERIINSDQIFWRRRTDSKSYYANVTASSGNASNVNNFRLFYTDNIDIKTSNFFNYMWTPSKDDCDKELIFEWNEDQDISLIRIYGNLGKVSYITKLLITINDELQFIIDGLLPQGQPVDIPLKYNHFVHKCSIKILDSIGLDYGITEVEFYSSTYEYSNIDPFIKILINDNFVYNYYIDNYVKELEIGIYKFNTTDKVRFEVVKGLALLEKNKLRILGNKPIVIQAFLSNNKKIFDQVIIYPKSTLWINIKKLVLKKEKYKFKIKNYVEHYGIKKTIYKIFKTLIKKSEYYI